MSIHSLPVEILSRVFVHGAASDDDSPFLLRPHHSKPLSKHVPTLETQIAVSHVCQRWRTIALNTPSLWTTLVFLKAPHIHRAAVLLNRLFPFGPPTDPQHAQRPVPTTKTIVILISTVARACYKEGENIAKVEMHHIFCILRPYLPAWRALHLVVRDNVCKAVAREHLGSCGPGPSLETLQLYHFEDFRVVDDLYEATYRPPVRVFGNDLPKLVNVSLIGVNLPWDQSPYLYDGRVKKLELALHTDNTRPPYEYWERMLRGCGDGSTEADERREELCTLEDLAVHYSGPKVGQGVDRYAWKSIDDGRLSPRRKSRRKIWMPQLERLSLTDLEPDYLCKILETLVLPAVRTLELNLPEDDFTKFVEMLGEEEAPPGREGSVSTAASPASDCISSGPGSSETYLEAALSTRTLSGMTLIELDPAHNGPVVTRHRPCQSALERPTETRTFPALWRVERLTVTALQCSADSWCGFLRALRGLKVLEIDFWRASDEAWDVLMEHNNVASIETKASKRPTLLPSLQTVKMSGLEGDKVAGLIRWRSMPPVHGETQGIKQWHVRWSERRKGRDKVLDEIVETGVRVFTRGRMAIVNVRCWDDDEEAVGDDEVDDEDDYDLDDNDEEDEIEEDEEEEEEEE